MKNLVKAGLVALALVFVAGCAHHAAPVEKTKAAKHHRHASKHCKGHKCVDKLGAASSEIAK